MDVEITEKGEYLDVDVFTNIKRRMVREFLDLIILSVISKYPCSGYDIIRYILSEYNILLSSGTVYSTLHGLERDRFLTGWWCRRKRMYKLDIKGRKYIQKYEKCLQLIHRFTYEFFNTIQNKSNNKVT